ncbi:MAG: thermonuclease family protein [bacterium]
MVTAVVILGMFILHRGMEREKSPSMVVQVQSLPLKGPFRVRRVLDGDTILLDNGETVRLIGVDAPEIHHPEIPVQRFGEEARQFLKGFAEGFECTLEYEPNNLRDQYGRLLAYVFVDGRLANAEMIYRGYAYAYLRFPFRRQAEFIALEAEAQKHQYGLWHLSLKDGRIANLVKRYESLNLEGRKRLDEILKELLQKYPFEEKGKIYSLRRKE